MAARPLPILALLAVLFWGGVARGQALETWDREVTALVDRLRPSVVKVHVETEAEMGVSRRATVSGVVVDDKGTVVTLGTAVRRAKTVSVELLDGERRPAKLLGVDGRGNIGVLEVDPKGLVPVEAAPSTGDGRARVGAFALVIGNPFGLTGTVGTGIVSGLGRDVEGVGVADGRAAPMIFYDLVQTSAPVNPGDSGGLLADSRGRMIGMVSSTFGRAPSVRRIRRMIRDFARSIDVSQVETFLGILNLTDDQKAMVKLLLARFREYQEKIGKDPTGVDELPEGVAGSAFGAQGINFAVPADQVLHAVRMIRRYGRMPGLGLSVVVPEEALSKQVGLEPGTGLVVHEVDEEGAAGKAGVRQYDILLSLGGVPLGHPRDLRRALVAAPVEGPVAIVLLRQGSRIETALRFD